MRPARIVASPIVVLAGAVMSGLGAAGSGSHADVCAVWGGIIVTVGMLTFLFDFFGSRRE